MFELIPFERQMRRMMSFDPFAEMRQEPARPVLGFRTDVKDLGEAYSLEAELPGFGREDINVDIENDILTISAKRSADSEEKKESYVKRERFYGSFRRSFDISGIDSDSVSASYADGILTLNMPKKKELLPQSRHLEIQ